MELLDKSSLLHTQKFSEYLEDDEKKTIAQTWFDDSTVDSWRHRRMYSVAKPLLLDGSHWLTVGDGRFGKDAHSLKKMNPSINIVASDLSDKLLKVSSEKGFIQDFMAQNAESLSLQDESFDFVFCKESLHHFPRPFNALSELLRVSKNGVLLIEPRDPMISDSIIPFLFIKFKKIIKKILGRSENDLQYEEIGNFLYWISEREIRKFSRGIGLHSYAFKKINDYYIEGCEFQKADPKNVVLKKMQLRISILNYLCHLGLLQSNILCVLLFKNEINAELKSNLLNKGWSVEEIGSNFH